MKATELNDKELRREIYALRRALRTDIKEVRDISKSSPTIPTYAISHLSKAENEMRTKSVKKREGAELLSIYRQLKYTRGLKSSTLEGALETAEKFEPIAEHLKSLSQEKRQEFWDIYGELYKHSSTLERFKYELFEYIDSKFGEDLPEDIASTLIEEYAKAVEGDYGTRTDEEIAIQFTSSLDELLSKLK